MVAAADERVGAGAAFADRGGADPVNITDPAGELFGLGDCATAIGAFAISKGLSTAAIATGGGTALGLAGMAFTNTVGAAVTAEACD